MPEPNRREFLASAGGALAAASLVSTEREEKSASGTTPSPIPPHRRMAVEGVHAYTDRVSVAAGELVRFYVSSSFPYELQICRLGTDVDGPSRDHVLHSFGTVPAAVQPIHPGSYLIAEKPLDPRTPLSALTLEIWVRRWRTIGRQAIISQLDEPDRCGLGLFVEEDGSLGFYLGDGGADVAEHWHKTPPGQLHMEVNPQGLKTFPDNTPSSVLSNRWHHVVARFDGTHKDVWVDGVRVAGWTHSGPVRAGEAALRIGAAGTQGMSSALLDADIAMPTIYARALSPAEIKARFADQGLSRPAGPDLLACWPLDEERGERAADASPHERHARIINRATWMIGGPGFDADVARFGTYDPVKDPRRGHGLRLASDDLFDCRWKVSQEFRLPEDARSGVYAGRIRFRLDGEERLYHSVFIVRKAAGRPRAPIAFLCSTNTWKAYAATPFSPTWKGIKKSIGNNGFANSPGDPPAFGFYRPHRAGQGSYQMGFRMPWPIVGPYTLMGPEEWDYSHLCRQDRFTQSWLETQGYDHDVLSDTDLHLDPNVLDGYRVLFVVGHSEYWSFEAMNAVSRFLDRGGGAIVLSGNTAFWRVSYQRRRDGHRVSQGRRARDPGPRRPSGRDVAQPRWASRRDGAGVRVPGLAALRAGVLLAGGCRRSGGRSLQGAQRRPFSVPTASRPEAARRRHVRRQPGTCAAPADRS